MKVIASSIDRLDIHYKCPYCKMKHHHGSGDDLSNRTIERVSHCYLQRGMVEITIDDTTKRKKMKLSKTNIKDLAKIAEFKKN